MNLYRKEKIEQTVQTYLNRKHRSEHPEGKFDKQMRWYPSEREKCECCEWIRQPSNAYPYSLFQVGTYSTIRRLDQGTKYQMAFSSYPALSR